ncbi:Hypothetical protein Ccan_19710 [Capnocytophaga canimorsus Cc5]|uniref:Uncharacterized protein n=1 Tax=Capnocytophaga canimorsus (strain 5) TaxID=860228 RepID=F9YTP2_CAPCC|nr:Hypothetical protein Ccan_19710 [Capnocytophaga canimorsus Cc5]
MSLGYFFCSTVSASMIQKKINDFCQDNNHHTFYKTNQL